jgi:hypothetical protein
MSPSHSREPLVKRLLPLIVEWGNKTVTDQEFLKTCDKFYQILKGRQCPHCGGYDVVIRAYKETAKGEKYPMFQCKDCKKTFSGVKKSNGKFWDNLEFETLDK